LAGKFFAHFLRPIVAMARPRSVVRVKKLVFVHRIPLENGKSFIAESDALRRPNKRGYVMTSSESLLNNLPPGPTSRPYDK